MFNSEGPLAEYARERRRRHRLEWGVPEPEYDDLETEEGKREFARRWRLEAEKNDLERVVFVTGGGNDNLADVVNAWPEVFIGFAHHSPSQKEAHQELRRAVDELGFRGYKIIAPVMDIPFDHPDLDPLWRFIADRGLPVLIHFGLLGTGGGVVYHPNINPLVLATTAHRYPDIPFVIAHFGCGYWGELLQLCWGYPNIYIDTSGSNQWMRWMPYPLTLEDLFRKAYETVGPERIVFGTDSSWFPRGFARHYLEEQLRVCRQLRMKEDEIELIFAGNARRLLGLDGP